MTTPRMAAQSGHTPIPVAVPCVDEMTEAQLRGHHCVWCGLALGLACSVDLGARIGEDGHHWYPRSCPQCAVPKLYRQLIEHTGSCEQCANEGALCSVAAGLRMPLREGRALAARAHGRRQ